jgi:hypothetical protein
MNEPFNYTVVIRGLDGVPLRTTSQGAKALMKSFHKEPNMEQLLLEAVDSGTPFKNSLVSVTAVFPRPKIKQATVMTAKAKAAPKKAVKKTTKRN